MSTTPQIEEDVELTPEEMAALPSDVLEDLRQQLLVLAQVEPRRIIVKANRQKAQMGRDLRRRVRKRQAKARTASRHSKKR